MAFVLLAMGTISRVQAQTVLFSDSFNRPDDLNLDTTTNGMGGTLISGGALGANGVWNEPVDLVNTDSDSQVVSSQLKMGGNGHSVEVFLNTNLVTLVSNTMVSISVDLKSAPTTTPLLQHYTGIGIGFSLAEGNATLDRALTRLADLYVAETANGLIRINDEAPSLRPGAGIDVPPTTTIDLDTNATAFIPGTLRVDFTVTNTAPGSTVIYDVFFNGVDIFNGTKRTFALTDTNEFYVGLEERSGAGVTNDNFSVSATSNTTPVSALVWRALTNNTWDSVTANWVDSASGKPFAFFPGASVTFDDTTANASVSVPGPVTPGAVLVNNASLNYTWSGAGSMGGTASLRKSGTGLLTVGLGNTYTGGTTLSAGRLRVGNNNALGSGLLTLSGGAISSDGQTARTLTNPVTVTAATAFGDATDKGALSFTGLVDFSGAAPALTINSGTIFAGGAANGTMGSKKGSGTLTIRGTVNYSGASDVQNGTVIYDGATVTNSDRLISDAGSGAGTARLVLTNGASVTVTTTVGNLRSGRTASSGTNYVDLAGLYSLPGADLADGMLTLQGNAAYSEVTFWPGGDFTARSVTNSGGVGNTVCKFNGGILRARNDNPHFLEGLSQALVQAGGATIDDGGFTIAINQSLLDNGGGLTKIGAGTLLLNGNNTYRGLTIVSNGTLGGSGIIGGPVSIISGATLAPGAMLGVVGALTINSNLVLNAGSFVSMEVDQGAATNDSIIGLRNVSYGGTLMVTNINGTPFQDGDAFTLFSASGAKTGNFSVITVLPQTGLVGNFNPASGVLTLTTPPPGTDFYTVMGNTTDNLLPVLTNDVGSGLFLVGVSSPLNGTAVVSGTNILYSPNVGFVGTDVFTYTNSNQLGVDSVLTVTVSVMAPPNINDRYQVLRNSSSNRLDVLRNDGAGLTLVSLSQPTNGTAFISGTNVIYTPSSNYFGADSFTYTVQDAFGSNLKATVALDVRQYPNFVFILADDQGWTGLSVQTDTNRSNSRSDYYRTPRMEKLASDGLRFSYGYAPHANCSPSRYANLTGKTCARLKMTDILGRNNTTVSNQFKLIAPGKLVDGIQSSDLTIAELLKTLPGANYSAAHFGKWHLAGGGPVAHGFDADANDGATDNSQGNTGPTPINPDPKLAYSITDRALAYLDSRVGNGIPFYLQVSHYAVHETTQTSQSSYDAFAGVPPGVWHTDRYYAGMTLDLDINVGRLLDKLDALGIRNSTYVLYTSDNGAPQAQSENYPLRGYKPEIWEGGNRVPMFIRGPGVAANAQCDVPVMGIDIFPTVWEWAGGAKANLPPDMDGGSLVALVNSIGQGTNPLPPVVRGGDFVEHTPHYYGPSPWPNDWVINPKDMRPRSAIHDGHYKLVANYEPGTIELYDLNSDIGEQTNLSPAQLAIKWQLWVRLRDYLKMVHAQMPTLDPSYRGTTNGTFALAAATGPLGDADADGLPDDWEFRELLTYQYNGNDDPSHSGLTLAQSYAQGKDPLIPDAYRINSITPVGPNQLQLTWNATPGASFVVETSTDLVHWAPANTVTAGDVFYGTVTILMNNPMDFFRVRKL